MFRFRWIIAAMVVVASTLRAQAPFVLYEDSTPKGLAFVRPDVPITELTPIAYTSKFGPGLDPKEIRTVHWGGQENSFVTTAGNFVPSHPTWSPDGTQVVFMRTAVGIVRRDLASGSETVLVSIGGSSEGYPFWSYSGNWIALNDGSVPNDRIYLVEPSGDNWHLVTDGRLACVSPDDQRIAFTRWVNGSPDVFVCNLDGSDVHNLTNDPSSYNGGDHAGPVWSPRGDWLAFVSGPDASHLQVWVMRPDGSAKTQITFGAPVSGSCLDWTRDGAFIVYQDEADSNGVFYNIKALATNGLPIFLNQPPACSEDFTDAMQNFLSTGPGSFVVTEGETIVASFTGTDPDGDSLTVNVTGLPSTARIAPMSSDPPLVAIFSWTPSAADKAGTPYFITVTFKDPAGESNSCTLTISDINLKPVCSASDQMLECTSDSGADVMLDGSASDPDDLPQNLSYLWAVSDRSVSLDDPMSATPTGTFPVGVTMATLVVTDGRGGVAVCDVLIMVEDTTPPEVMCTTDVAALWPPNHMMQPVTLVVTATDACTYPSQILPIVVWVSSSEPDDANGDGDGNTSGDVGGQDGHFASVDVTGSLTYDAQTDQWRGTILLRAERDGSGRGRKYTIDIRAIDASGNAAVTSCCVVVPHDQRR